MDWVWEPIDEARSGSSGDVSKLFKNDLIKHPGMLARSAPGADATIMAREVIQNSWDAAHDLRADLGFAAPFSLIFRFQRLDGPQRDRTEATLNLSSLAQRANQLDWSKIGLPHHAFQHGDTLPILTIEEHASSGMHGRWLGAQSKMYLALVSIGFTVKPSGAGGSYGYGKAGLIRGSSCRTVVAYSCFRERHDDPGVTRRLLGMTYWGPHDIDGVTYSGFARLGHRADDGTVRPFENDDADAVATALGMDLRDAADTDQLGTSFIVVDPTVGPVELRRAIERNWWPVLHEDSSFDVRIVDPSGRNHTPDPSKSSELTEFVRAFDLARGAAAADTDREKVVVLQRHAVGDRTLGLGALGMVADQAGWSYPTEDDVEHRSLVALVRGPKMVVEYLEAGVAKPFVRGAFLAHADVDDLLRQTEPRGHDAWQPDVGDDSIDPAAPQVAKTILGRIRQNVATFRRDIKPPIPDRRDIRLPELEKLFRLVVENEGKRHPPPPPPLGPRPVSISVRQCTVEAVDRQHVRLRAQVALTARDLDDSAEQRSLRLHIQYRFLEHGRPTTPVSLQLGLPSTFDLDGGTVVGAVGNDPVVISVLSTPYPNTWSGQLTVSADVADGHAVISGAVA